MRRATLRDDEKGLHGMQTPRGPEPPAPKLWRSPEFPPEPRP